ncbi:MAG: hypothetical protein K5682_08000, partial [Lachnospiraceae bacterium]|nr:hypothetical protein [Lachnospiraceae bacterium]
TETVVTQAPPETPMLAAEEVVTNKAQEWIKLKRQLKNENQDKTKEELDQILKEAREKFFAEPILTEEQKEEYQKQKNGELTDAEQNADADQSADAAQSKEEAQSSDTVQTAETVQPVEQEAEAVAYNALADLHYILMQGSRFGYHFATYLTGYADIKITGFKTDWFRHRISFQMSADDSRAVFNTKIASTLPEHVCQYYDLLDGFSFRPYLNKGIDWDGWGVSENGELISPNI